MAEKTGYLDFRVDGEVHQTWYRVFGDLHNSTSLPVIMIHGGPGMSYDYLVPFIDLHTSSNIPVVFYDQIGIGHSTHLPKKPKSFWTVELFMDELQNLIDGLQINKYDIIGHSWGGMLASTFAAERKPKGLNRLVLSSVPASMELWEVGTSALLQGLPKELREMLERHEREGTTDDEEYQKGTLVFYRKHICTLDPWPKEILDSIGAMMEDKTVYHTMVGPSEFHISGTLKTWSVIDKLQSIDYSVLLINSVNDEAQDVCVLPFFKHLPNVKWYQFTESDSTHMPFWEHREKYFKLVLDFLTL